MSYAAAASRGPRQTAEEKRAPLLPQVELADSVSTSSLIDVDSDSVHTVPSTFSSQEIQTSTQQDRLQREAEAEEARAKEEYARAKKDAKKGASNFSANTENPIFLGNAIAVVGLSGLLGFGAYRKYVGGELSWKVVGAWAGIVGLFAAGDYYLSQYVLKKFPAKK